MGYVNVDIVSFQCAAAGELAVGAIDQYCLYYIIVLLDGCYEI